MNVHDEMSDNEVLRAASDSLSTIPMATPPDVAAIMARGRARRRHRLSAVTGLSVAGVAAGTALALGLTGVLGPARTPGTIRAAAFTLASNSNGTATLTIKPGRAARPRRAAERPGATRHPGEGHHRQLLLLRSRAGRLFAGRVLLPAGPYTATPQNGAQPTITIDPAAMPAGTELSVGDFQLSSGEFSGQQQADFVLIDTSSYTCSSTPPDPNGLPVGYGPSDGIGLLYGGPGPAGS